MLSLQAGRWKAWWTKGVKLGKCKGHKVSN